MTYDPRNTERFILLVGPGRQRGERLETPGDHSPEARHPVLPAQLMEKRGHIGRLWWVAYFWRGSREFRCSVWWNER